MPIIQLELHEKKFDEDIASGWLTPMTLASSLVKWASTLYDELVCLSQNKTVKIKLSYLCEDTNSKHADDDTVLVHMHVTYPEYDCKTLPDATSVKRKTPFKHVDRAHRWS